jgi:rhodanese-related sulfurtransferase
MKTILQTLLSTILLITIASCDAPEKTAAQINNIAINAAADLVKNDKNIVVLDVRTPEEHAAGHIEGSVNINIAEDSFSEEAAKLDHNKTYIVHCAANVENGRTAKSLVIMKELGFKNLLNLEGGIVAWEKNGQAMIKIGETKDHQEPSK